MLHGDIKVNDQVIGEWTAVRTDEIIRDGAYRRYACTMNYRDQQGYPMTATYDVMHPPGDRPVLLAAKVLAKGHLYLRRTGYTVDDSPETIKANRKEFGMMDPDV